MLLCKFTTPTKTFTISTDVYNLSELYQDWIAVAPESTYEVPSGGWYREGFGQLVLKCNPGQNNMPFNYYDGSYPPAWIPYGLEIRNGSNNNLLFRGSAVLQKISVANSPLNFFLMKR